jgi:hypothetical protein
MKLIDRCISCKYAEVERQNPNIIDSKIVAWCQYDGSSPCTDYVIENPEEFGCIYWSDRKNNGAS